MIITAENFAKWSEDAQYAFPGDIGGFSDWTLQVLRHGENQVCWSGDIWMIQVGHHHLGGPSGNRSGHRAPSPGAPCRAQWLPSGALHTVSFQDGVEIRLSEADGDLLARPARAWAREVAEKHFNLEHQYSKWRRNQPWPGEKSLERLAREDNERRAQIERDHYERRHRNHIEYLRRAGEAGYLDTHPLNW